MEPVAGQGSKGHRKTRTTRLAFLLINDLAMGPIKYQGDDEQQVYTINPAPAVGFINRERTKSVRKCASREE